MASGLFLRPGNPSHSMQGSVLPSSLPATLRVAMRAGPSRSTDPQSSPPIEHKSPYPGINIGSASELLDFRFEDTELLQGSED